MPKDLYIHGKDHQLWLAATAAGLAAAGAEVTGYIKDTGLSQTRGQSKATTAGDRTHVYGPPGQVDGKLSISGPWTPQLDRLVQGAITRDEPLYYRYRPAGTAAGRLQLEGTVVVTSRGVSAPDGLMTLSMDANHHDLDFARTVQ